MIVTDGNCLRCGCVGRFPSLSRDGGESMPIANSENKSVTMLPGSVDGMSMLSGREESKPMSGGGTGAKECSSGCVFCPVRHCFTCDSPFVTSHYLPHSHTQVVFTCGNAECKEKHDPLYIRNVNTPIPPLNRTLLHTTISAGDCELTWKLLLCGANPCLADRWGMDCVDLVSALCRQGTSASKLRENYNRIYKMLPTRSTIEGGSGKLPHDEIPTMIRAISAPLSYKFHGENVSKSNEIEDAFFLPEKLVRAHSDMEVEQPVLQQRGDTYHFYFDDTADPTLFAQQPSLLSGRALLTPLTLVRATSESDAGTLRDNSCSNDKKMKLEVVMGYDSLNFDGLVELLAPTCFFDCSNVNHESDTYSNLVNGSNNSPPLDEEMVRLLTENDTRGCEDNIADIKDAFQESSPAIECVSCYDQDVVYRCPSTRCRGALCERCMYFMIYVRVRDAMYAVPPVRCPGFHFDNRERCVNRIPTNVWRKCLHDTVIAPEHIEFFEYDERLVTSSESNGIMHGPGRTVDRAGNLLMKKYEQNAAAILTIRCGDCDQTYTLLISSLLEDHPSFSRADMCMKITEIVNRHFLFDRHIDVLQCLCKYCEGLVTAREMLEVTIDSIIPPKSIEEKIDGYLPGELRAATNSLASLMFDVERRVNFQLTVLQMFPHFDVPCCSVPFCFMCKIMSHHVGLSCMNYQRFEMGTNCQYCPSCGVATMRSEGCSQIRCVCGQSWTWDTTIVQEEVGSAFKELVDQLASSDESVKMSAFRAVSALCRSSQADLLLQVLKPTNVFDAIGVTAHKGDWQNFGVALDCLEAYCAHIREHHNWYWTGVNDGGDGDYGDYDDVISHPQVVTLNIIIDIVRCPTINCVKILRKCMRIIGDNCQFYSFQKLWHRRIRINQEDEGQLLDNVGEAAIVIIECHKRAAEILVWWFGDDSIDKKLVACEIFNHFVSAGEYIRDRMLTESLRTLIPNLVPIRDMEESLIKKLRFEAMRILCDHPDKEDLCIASSQGLLSCIENDDAEVIRFLYDYFQKRMESGNVSKEVSLIYLRILETIPLTCPDYAQFVQPQVAWLVQSMGYSFSPEATARACVLLLQLMHICVTPIVDTNYESKILTLLRSRQENGKEESYYGEAIKVYVSGLSMKPLATLSDEHICQMVVSLMQMIRSEDAPNYTEECRDLVLLLNQLIVHGRSLDIGTLMPLDGDAINSIVNLLEWEYSVTNRLNKELLCQVVHLLSNLAAMSIAQRDSILKTNILAKVGQFVFDLDFAKNVTHLSPFQMEQVCALLYHMVRGGGHDVHGGEFDSHIPYTVVNVCLPMFSNISKYEYSSGCLTYLSLFIEAVQRVHGKRLLQTSFFYRASYDEVPIPTKPKDLAILSGSAFTWQNFDLFANDSATIDVLVECAKTEMKSEISKSSITFQFLNCLLNIMIGGSPAHARLVWGHPDVMKLVLDSLQLRISSHRTVMKILFAIQKLACMTPSGICSHVRAKSSFCLSIEPSLEISTSVEILQRKLRKTAVAPFCEILRILSANRSQGISKRVITLIGMVYSPFCDNNAIDVAPPVYFKFSRIRKNVQECIHGLEAVLGTLLNLLFVSTYEHTVRQPTYVHRRRNGLVESISTLLCLRNQVLKTPPEGSGKWQLWPSATLPVSSTSLVALCFRMIPMLSDGFLAGIPVDVVDLKRHPDWCGDNSYAECCAMCFASLWYNVVDTLGDEGENKLIECCQKNNVAQKIIAIMLTTKLISFVNPLSAIRRCLKIRHYTVNKVIDVFYVSDVDNDNKLHGFAKRYERSNMKDGEMRGLVQPYTHGVRGGVYGRYDRDFVSLHPSSAFYNGELE